MSKEKLSAGLFRTVLSTIGWIALSVSIFCTFTLLPMSLILSFLESGGQIVSSGESGGYWFLIAIYSFLPGVVGIFLLWLRRRIDGDVQRVFLRNISVFIALQIIGIAVSAILSPYNPDPRNTAFEKKLSTKDYESFRKLFERREQ
jgi:hypothetical protein